MTLEEIYTRLKKVSIPVAYLFFKTPQKPPFIAYYESGTSIDGADVLNLYRSKDITIELYADSKMPEIERKIEELFNDVPLDKATDIYIENEKLLKVEYTFTTIETGG